MLDAVADALARQLLLAVPAGRPRGRDDLDRLPPPVGHLLAVVLDRRIVHEAALPRTAWLDDEAEPVRAAARAWREAARCAAH